MHKRAQDTKSEPVNGMTNLLEMIRNKLCARRSITVALSGLWNATPRVYSGSLAPSYLCGRQNNKFTLDSHRILRHQLMNKHLQRMRNTFLG